MFMIEKSLMIVIFLYSFGFCMLGIQYIYFDVFHATMTNFSGVPLKNNLINDLNQNTINQVTNNIVQTNQTSVFLNSIGIAANIAWDLILLLSGTYIFDLAIQFGVPIIFVVGFIILYLFLVGRSIMGYIRGI